MVGEGLLQMKKSEENERFAGTPSSGFQPLSPQRRRQRTNWLLLTKNLKLINEINDSKTIARFGRGGTTLVVGEGLVKKIKSSKN